MSIPDWLLERYVLDEVTPEQRAQVEADPELGQRLVKLNADTQRIREDYPIRSNTVAIQQAAQARRRPSGFRRFARGGALVAAALLTVLVIGVLNGGERAKGGDAELRVYRQLSVGSEALVSGDEAREGDVIQLGYAFVEHPYAWLISIDGHGVMTLHNEGHLEPGAAQLDVAYRLDDAPLYEQFFLVTDDAPIQQAAVDAAAERYKGSSELGVEGTNEVSIRLVKP